MKEVAFRSIFPNNNIPNIRLTTHYPTLKEKLSLEISSVINYMDYSKFTTKIKELEFKVHVEEDPVNALLEKLQEFNNN